MALPVLERSTKTKTNNEVWVYYNLDVGVVKKTKQASAIGGGVVTFDHQSSGCGTAACPANSFDATINKTPNHAAIGAIPANSPLGQAAEGDLDPVDPGDVVDVACLPDPANDVLICYDQSAAPTPGLTQRPVPRKFNPVDHYVLQRPDNTISLGNLYVSNLDGLQRIQGRPCTIILKITPDGSGIFSEIQYYCNVILNPMPMNSASDGNASIEVSLSGTFSFFAVFSATP